MATVEYAGLVVLVGLVTAAGGGVVGTERVPHAVEAQMRRAMCLVQGGDCLGDGGPRPCVVGTDERSRDVRARVVLLRLGDGRAVLREEHSDGSIAVTVLASSDAGAAVAWGGQATIGGRGVRASAEAGAGLGATYGRRFVVRDRAAADLLVARLAEEDWPVGGAARGVVRFLRDEDDGADERLVEIGARREAQAVLSAVGLRGRAGSLAAAAAGLRVARQTGLRTVVLRLERELGAALSAPLGARVGAGAGAVSTLEVTFDRHGTARALTLRRAQAVHGEVDVGPVAERGGDRLETEARLNLTDPRARALADGLLDRLGAVDPAALGAARALGERLAGHARVDVRLYATRRDERVSGVDLAFVAGLGGEITHTTETARLVAAAGREPGLGWARRLDCGLARVAGP